MPHQLPLTTRIGSGICNRLQEKRNTGSMKKLLIVDPDYHTTDLIEAYLDQEEYSCLALHDEDLLFENLDYEYPDLILLSMDLPKGNTPVLLKTIRSKPEFRQIPVLVLTYSDNMKSLDEFFDEGADDYLTKPILRVR